MRWEGSFKGVQRVKGDRGQMRGQGCQSNRGCRAQKRLVYTQLRGLLLPFREMPFREIAVEIKQTRTARDASRQEPV